MRCLSERGGLRKHRSYWKQQMYVLVGQTGNPPVFEVRPEGRTGKPGVLHRNLLLPFDFLQVDHPDPPTHQSKGKWLPVLPRKFEKDCTRINSVRVIQKIRMTRLVCPLQSLRHCSCVHPQETLNVVQKERQRLGIKLTEDVAIPHGHDVTDDPVLLG